MQLDVQPRIVVVGGGVSGLHTAYRLQKALPLSSVTVLEKDNHVGGHLWQIPLSSQERAATGIVVTLPGSSRLRRLCRELLQRDLVQAAQGFQGVMDVTQDTPALHWMQARSPVRHAPRVVMLAWLAQGFVRYAAHHRRLLGPNYDTTFPSEWTNAEELKTPLPAWLRRHRLESLTTFFELVLRCYGYGPLNEVPVLYALLYVSAETALTFVREPFHSGSEVLPGGFYPLAQAMASRVKHVHTGITLTAVERNKRSGTWTVHARDGRKWQADAVVWACPPSVVRRLCPVAVFRRILTRFQTQTISAHVVEHAWTSRDRKRLPLQQVWTVDESRTPMVGLFENRAVSLSPLPRVTTVFLMWNHDKYRPSTANQVWRRIARPQGCLLGEKVWRKCFPHWRPGPDVEKFFALHQHQGTQNHWLVGNYCSFDCMEAVIKQSQHVVDRVVHSLQHFHS